MRTLFKGGTVITGRGPKRADVLIEGEKVRQIGRLILMPADRTVEILTEELSVHLFGTAAELEGITGEDVTVTADLSDYAVASGTYMVPAQIEVGDTVGVSGTYQVQIRIPEAEE